MRKNRNVLIAMILVLAIMVSVGLTACGDNSADNTGGVNTEAPDTTPSEELTPTPTAPPAEPTEDKNASPFKIFQYELPSGYKKANELAGTVTEETYTTYLYDNDGVAGEEIESSLYIYLPYGYDESKEYNVLYLMHGGGEEVGYWFGMAEYAEGGERYNRVTASFTTNVIDNMIANGDCDDVIVVTPTWNNNGTTNFKYELRNDVIPFVEGKYASYAGGDVTPDNLIATRDHRAFGGFSAGSMTAFSVWNGCFDYIAYIGTLSAWDDSGEAVIKEMLDGIYADYEMKYWYNGQGTLDFTVDAHVENYARMLEEYGDLWQEGEDFANGDNCIMVNKPGKGHAYNNWIVDLYNMLEVFFKMS